MEKKLSLYNIAINNEVITEDLQQINEDFIEYALMGAGFIPVVGEVFDTVLILRYCKQRRFLEAGLMMVALIPAVGDLMVKPFLILFKNSGKLASVFAKKLAANPAAKAKFTQIAGKIDDSIIDKFIAGVAAKNKSWGEALVKAKDALKTFIKNISKPGTTIKKGFQAKAAARYAAKHGGKEASGFYKWWKGRRIARSTMKKIIVGSNILSALGLPSFEVFEKKMEDPEFANEVVNTPEYENILSQIKGSEGGQSNTGDSSDLINNGVTMELLKKLASMMA